MKNKKGQFFILAAVIIAVVLVGIATTKNYISAKEKPKRFFDLSKEIKMEAGEVIDFGIVKAGSGAGKFLESFIIDAEENFYVNNPDNELIFVYGNNDEVNVLNMAKEDLIEEGVVITGGRLLIRSTISQKLESITATIPVDTPLRIIKSDTSWKKSFSRDEKINEVTITFNNQPYDFTLGENQRFYLIIRRNVDNEIYIDKK